MRTSTVPRLAVLLSLTALCAAACTTPSTDAPDSAVQVEDEPRDTAAEALAADDARVRALTGLPEGDAPCAPPMLARVDYAVDGDTLYVYPDDGSPRTKVRLIGLNTPEVEHDDPAECYGNDAWDFTQAALTGRLVWITFDAECQDDYGRTLAFLHRDTGESGFHNRRLLREGYATQLTVQPNDTYASTFRADEQAARSDGNGLWAACTR